MPGRKRGPYKAYLNEANSDVPKTTKWRRKQPKSTNPSEQESGVDVNNSIDSEPKTNEQCEELEISTSEHFNGSPVTEDLFTADVEGEHLEKLNCSEEWDLDEGDSNKLESEADSSEEQDSEEEEITNFPNLQESGFESKSKKENEPLYAGANVKVGEAMLLILLLYIKHHLTQEALGDMLLVLDILLIAPHGLAKTFAQFKAMFSYLQRPFEFHYMCKKCNCWFGQKTDVPETCTVCLADLSESDSLHWFVTKPIKDQLKDILSDPQAAESISEYRTKRQKENESAIEDVLDGKVYKERFTHDGYFRESDKSKWATELHISFQMNTDGVALFHSSAFSVWPLYMTINELDPKLRQRRKYRIFSGLWFGCVKPDFRAFLKPFAYELRSLYHTGFKTVISGVEKNVRSMLLCGTFDSPARCLFMNMVQFNGFSGCPYCTTPGVTFKTERGTTHTYPFDSESASGHGEKRTHTTAKEDAKDADASGTRVNGFKGTSWALHLPGYDIVRGTACDYMHQTLLGVTKMLAHLWFDPAHKKQAFSIWTNIDKVDERLLKIKPPNRITRTPRTLHNLSKFKASEWRSFLLFFSIPCLFDILPQQYFNHLLLLIEAIHLMLGTSILPQQLCQARKLLVEFCRVLGTLYGPRYQTSNVHLLLHLVDKVEDLGPLWATSLFYFEDLNGDLRSMFNGSQRVEMQILQAVNLRQKVPILEAKVMQGTRLHDVVCKLNDGQKRYDIREEVSASTRVIGAINVFVPSASVKQAIQGVLGLFREAYKFKRLYNHGSIIHSLEYKIVKKRNSHTISFFASDGSVQYAEVMYFIKVLPECPVKQLCTNLCLCKIPKYCVVLQLLENKIVPENMPHFSHGVIVNRTNTVIATDLVNIKEVVVNAKCGSAVDLVLRFPNTWEKD